MKPAQCRKKIVGPTPFKSFSWQSNFWLLQFWFFRWTDVGPSRPTYFQETHSVFCKIFNVQIKISCLKTYTKWMHSVEKGENEDFFGPKMPVGVRCDWLRRISHSVRRSNNSLERAKNKTWIYTLKSEGCVEQYLVQRSYSSLFKFDATGPWAT